MKRSPRHRLLLPILAAAFLFFATVPATLAQGGIINNGPGGQTVAPEIDPALIGSGMALLGGVMLVIRGRRNP